MGNIQVKGFFFKFGPVAQEEMSFKEKVYRRRTKTNHNSSPWAFGSGELKTTTENSMQSFFALGSSPEGEQLDTFHPGLLI